MATSHFLEKAGSAASYLKHSRVHGDIAAQRPLTNETFPGTAVHFHESLTSDEKEGIIARRENRPPRMSGVYPQLGIPSHVHLVAGKTRPVQMQLPAGQTTYCFSRAEA